MRVEYCGELTDVEAERGLTLGASGDIVLDTNDALDDVVAHVGFDGDLWWLANRSRRVELGATDESKGLRSYLPPGARFPIAFAAIRVEFRAGPTVYDFCVIADRDDLRPRGLRSGSVRSIARPDLAGSARDRIPLTPSQRLLLVALCERDLRGEPGGPHPVPVSWALAERLGWTLTAFNRRLDTICEKLDRAGVPGVRGARGMHAGDRRQRLAEFAVSHDLVVASDLDLLPSERELRATG